MKRKVVLLIMVILALVIFQKTLAVPREIESLYYNLYPSSINQVITAKMLVEIADGLLYQESMENKKELSLIQLTQFTQLAIDNRDEIEKLGVNVENLIAQVERYLRAIDDFKQVASQTDKIKITLGTNSWLEVIRASGPGRNNYGSSHRNSHNFNINIEGQVTPLVSLKTNFGLYHIYGATPQTDLDWGFEMKGGSLYTVVGPFKTQFGNLRFDYGNLAASFTPLTVYGLSYRGAAAAITQLGRYRINILGSLRKEATPTGVGSYDRYFFGSYLQDIALPNRMRLNLIYTLLKDDPLSINCFSNGPLPWAPLSSNLLGMSLRGSMTYPGQMHSWNGEFVFSSFSDKGERSGNRNSLTPYYDYALLWNVDSLFERGKYKVPIQFGYRRIGSEYVSYYGDVVNLGLGSEIFTTYAGTSKKSQYAAPDFEYQGDKRDYLLNIGKLASNTTGFQIQLREFRPGNQRIDGAFELFREISSTDSDGDRGETLKHWRNFSLSLEQDFKNRFLNNPYKVRANFLKRSVNREDDPLTTGYNYSDDNEAIDLNEVTKSLSIEYNIRAGLRVTGTLSSKITSDTLPRPNGKLVLAEGETGISLGLYWLPLSGLTLYPTIGLYDNYFEKPQIGEKTKEYQAIRFSCRTYWYPMNKISLVVSFTQEKRSYADPEKDYIGRSLSATYYASF